jgi:hypothetical protein
MVITDVGDLPSIPIFATQYLIHVVIDHRYNPRREHHDLIPVHLICTVNVWDSTPLEVIDYSMIIYNDDLEPWV